MVKASGVDVKMITGDALPTALAIARSVGVVDDSIDPAKQIDERLSSYKAHEVHALSGEKC